MKKALFTLAAISLASTFAFAQKPAAVAAPEPQNSISVAVSSVLDSRVRYFAYNEDVVYTLPITVGMHTHLVLGADEQLTAKPKMGETIQWRVSGDEKNLYIKSLKEGQKTSLTLVTSKRSYQFELVSISPNAAEKRVQKVYFSYPDEEEKVDLAVRESARVTADVDARDKKSLDALRVSPARDASAFNFEYEVVGAAPFRPSVVYDDGTFTHIRFPKLQDLPAVFMVEPDGKLSPINYTVHGPEVLVERVASEFVLKLGKEELRVKKAQ